MKYIVLFFIIISLQINTKAQSSVTNTVQANVNLAGIPYNETVENSQEGIFGSSSSSCMEAFGASFPDGTLKVRVNSSACGMDNAPSVTTGWFVDFEIGGNNGVDIPLTFNFSITSSTNIVSMAFPDCLSMATAKFSGRAYSTNKDEEFSSQIGFQKGFMYYYKEENFDDSEVRASLGLAIALGTDDIQLIHLSDNDVKSFLNHYKNLDRSDQVLGNNIFTSLSSSFPVSSLELYSGEITQRSRVILNFLRDFELLDKLNIDFNDEMAVGLTATVSLSYDFSRSVEITTHDQGYIAGKLYASSKSSPCGGTSASVGASNSFNLNSITIPNNFDHPEVDEEKLFVEWNGNEYPVMRESETASVKKIYNKVPLISLFPNPVTDYIQIRSENDWPIFSITITNTDGMSVIDRQYLAKNNIKQVSLPLEEIREGVYTIRVVTSVGTFHQLIVAK